MSRIALLIKSTPQLEDDNYLRFGKCLSESCDITLIPVDTLQLVDNQVSAAQFPWREEFSAGTFMPELDISPINQDLLWILSLGTQHSFLDKYQLLYVLSKKCRIMNSLQALMHLNSKYYLATQPKLFPQPETHASRNSSELARIINSKRGKWIIKPPAGSLGRDVFLVEPSDTNLNSILEHLCGSQNTNYTMIQRYVKEIEEGEKRVILAGGKVIDQYKRLPSSDHRTNVSRGALTEHCELSGEERGYCESLAEYLLKEGVHFAGIDLAWPWLIEINVINPGGLLTIEGITGRDRNKEVIEAIFRTL